MAFCANCGTESDGSFCPNCGAGMTTGATGAGAVPPAGSAAFSSSGLTENLASALCYLLGLVTGILFLLLPPYNRNRTVRFHAFQSIFAHIAVIVIAIVLSMLGIVTHGIGFGLFPLLWLAVIVLWIYLMYQAYNNHKIKLPFVGDLAEKQA